MNLKEAFHYQSYLKNLIDRTVIHCSSARNVMETISTHNRKAANPDATDEVIAENPTEGLPCDVNRIVDFAIFLLNERENLSIAIMAAKKTAAIDIDGACSMNRCRQAVANVLTEMGRRKNTMTKSNGYDNKFNAEGNQVAYTYKVDVEQKIAFDRNKVRNEAESLYTRADEMSAEIDKTLLNIVVDYDAPFSTKCSWEEALEHFCADK